MATTLPDIAVTELAEPSIERVRHELRRRTLIVKSAVRITPGMLRLIFSSEALADFTSLGFDDHIKLLVPGTSDAPERRDYTPRRYDRAGGTLTIDFAVHDAGPVTRWAIDACPGDVLEIGGPRGSAVISGDVRNWLLIGDETALPAIGRRIEEAAAGDRITSVVAVVDDREHQSFDTRAQLTTLWVHRPLSAAGSASALIAALESIDLPPRTFVWIAAEGGVARSIRDYLSSQRQHPRSWMKAAGYWSIGKTDSHEKID